MAIKRLQPTVFAHFYDPATGEKEYADAQKQKPVGVLLHSPGSKKAKDIESQILQANLDRRSAKASAAQVEQSALARIASSTIEFVNFDAVPGYEHLNDLKDPKDIAAAARTFYQDLEYAHLRDQVQEKLADFSASLPEPVSNSSTT